MKLVKEEQPFYKVLNKGVEVATDAELLSLIIGNKNNIEKSLQLARKILDENHNSLRELSKLTIHSLVYRYPQLSKKGAVNIVSILSLVKRIGDSEIDEKQSINDSRTCYSLLRSKLEFLEHEEFWILLLNRGNKVLNMTRISSGGITGTVIDIRMIFKIAIELNATGVVLAHNHPSGNLKPSEQDVKVTHQIREAGLIFEIPVIDHLIVSEKGYYSFADEGNLWSRGR